MVKQPGRVYLVGAGPGDPEMLTLRGAACLRKADVVLYDYLVNPRTLRHCPPETQLICLGSHAEGKLWSQAKINQAMVDFSHEGKQVVRLKGGDPAIFARTAEEVQALIDGQIQFEIVPGITTALAAGSCTGVPITHRDMASAVAILTGHECREKQESALDFGQLAKFPGTLVIYMGTTTVRSWTDALIANGKPGDTPVTAIRRCSWHDQTQFHCRLDELADRVEQPPKLRPPVIFIVGQVAKQPMYPSWFESRPLFGQRIWVTRPLDQALETAEQLEDLGAFAEIVPAIEVRPLEANTELDQAIAELADFDWIVFASANGVRFFFQRLFELGKDLRLLANIKIASIGEATSAKLKELHLNPYCQAVRQDSEGLIEALQQGEQASQRFLVIRANRGRDVIKTELEARGSTVVEVAAYENVDLAVPNESHRDDLQSQKIDWVMVTSSAIANSLHHQFGSTLKQTKLASLSPITSSKLRELGLEPSVEAKEASLDSLIQAMADFTNNLA